MKKSIILFSLFVFLNWNCEMSTDDDLGEYYEGNFNDSVIITSEPDTVNIVIEQRDTQFHKMNIPFTTNIFSTNSDSVNLMLFVSYGSYDKNPKPIKEVSNNSDTFYVWYSLVNKPGGKLSKNNSITMSNASPKISYVSIDSIIIQKGTNKVINLLSRLVH